MCSEQVHWESGGGEEAQGYELDETKMPNCRNIDRILWQKMNKNGGWLKFKCRESKNADVAFRKRRSASVS